MNKFSQCIGRIYPSNINLAINTVILCMNQAIIFDTNAYRNLTVNRSFDECKKIIDRIVTQEAINNNLSFLSPIVLIELAAHLNDTNDKAYLNCKNAYASCYLHCKDYVSENFRMIPDGESHLAKVLFNYENTVVLDKLTAYGQLAYRTYADFSENNIDSFRKHFQEMSKYVEFVETQFVTDMHTYIVKELNPEATDWHPLKQDKVRRKRLLQEIKSDKPIDYFALAQVVKASDIANVKLDDYDLFDLTDRVKSVFPAPLYLYKNIFNKIVESGADLTNPKKKRWNWIWDIQILFSISDISMASKDTLLVTSDNDVIAAANAAGLSNKIMPLKDYLLSIGISDIT